jgi:chorismate mutase
MSGQNDRLAAARRKIATVDSRLVALLDERARLVREELKAMGSPVRDMVEDAAVLDRVRAASKGYPAPVIRSVFERVLEGAESLGARPSKTEVKQVQKGRSEKASES